MQAHAPNNRKLQYFCLLKLILLILHHCLYRMQEKYSILRNKTYNLVKAMLSALTGTSESQCKILLHVIEYVFFVLSEKIKNQHGDEAIVALEDLNKNDRPATVVEYIGQWIQSQKVIGHVKFGGAQSKKFREEVQVSYCSSLQSLMLVYSICRYGKCSLVRN